MIKRFAVLLLVAIMLMPTMAVYAATQIEGYTPSGIVFSEMESRIDDIVAKHQTALGVAVVVVQDGEIVFSKGYGYANSQNRTAIDPATTVFEIGSTSKLFVWVAIMQLLEQGLLELDTYVRHYLPEDFYNQLAFEKPFTVRDLMNHQAGFGENLFDSIFDAQRTDSSISFRDGLLLAQPAQLFEPSTVTAYSNFGTALAGYIVGYITGQDFYFYEMENIFAPAGMTNTLNQPSWFGNTSFLQSKATGYISDGQGGFRQHIWSYFPMYPAGAVNATAEDLARFAIALMPPNGESGPLFESPNTLATIFTNSSLDLDNPTGTYHGFVRYVGAFPTFGHAGDTSSFSTEFSIVPEKRFGVIIIANTGGAVDIRFDIESLLVGNNFDEVHPLEPNLPSASAVEGRFATTRSHAGSLMEFMDYLFMPTINVVATSENTIRLSFVGMDDLGSAEFMQVEPYTFGMISVDSPILAIMIGDGIRFVMEDGIAVHGHVNSVFDLITPMRSQLNLAVGAVGSIISMLFFLLMPFVLLIVFLLNRKKGNSHTRFHYASIGFLTIGTLLAINNLVAIIRILVINMFRSASEISPHVWINYMLASLAVITMVGFIVYFRKERSAEKVKGKVLCGVTMSFLVMLIVVLFDWNFFVTP